MTAASHSRTVFVRRAVLGNAAERMAAASVPDAAAVLAPGSVAALEPAVALDAVAVASVVPGAAGLLKGSVWGVLLVAVARRAALSWAFDWVSLEDGKTELQGTLASEVPLGACAFFVSSTLHLQKLADADLYLLWERWRRVSAAVGRVAPPTAVGVAVSYYVYHVAVASAVAVALAAACTAAASLSAAAVCPVPVPPVSAAHAALVD